MQVHTFDQWEFDPPDAEETLLFAFAKKKEFNSAVEFLDACPHESKLPWGFLAKPLQLQKHPRCKDVQVCLDRFPCSPESITAMSILAVLDDEWSDFELLLESSERYFWFNWYTTA